MKQAFTIVRESFAIRNVSETFEWRIRQRSCYGSRFSEAAQRRTALLAGAGRGALLNSLRACGHAFTMAEILLSLTIIGVVAAITLPSLTGNINERTWNTQRKALYARMSQAISLMPALNGYGTLKEESSSGAGDAVDTAAETFVTAGLAKVLKINNVCDNEHLADCGIVSSLMNMAGSQITIPTNLYELNSWFKRVSYYGISYSNLNTKAVAFETQNGESIITYYNQSCKTEYLNEGRINDVGETFGFPHLTMCVNFIYDLNGRKGPNTVGKDIGIITVFNSIDSNVVAPIPVSVNNAGSGQWQDAIKLCNNSDNESRIPNIDELSAMIINNDIFNLTDSWFWSGTAYSQNQAWAAGTVYGYRYTGDKTIPRNIRCVKR